MMKSDESYSMGKPEPNNLFEDISEKEAIEFELKSEEAEEIKVDEPEVPLIVSENLPSLKIDIVTAGAPNPKSVPKPKKRIFKKAKVSKKPADVEFKLGK